jgi:hypothetical protein
MELMGPYSFKVQLRTDPDDRCYAIDGAGAKHGHRIPGLFGRENHGDSPRSNGLEVVAGGTASVGGPTP